ncbi:MAG: cytochrome c [Variovorax sp.]|nr:MAG: cytochrome c [Variovorax sp.]
MHSLHCRRLIPAAALLSASLLLVGCDIGERRLPYDAASPARVARGQTLLAQYQCGSCHAIPGVDAARGAAGPPLSAFGRRSYIAGHLPNRPETLARWIESPAALVPGTSMPSMGVSPDDARAMAGYLLSLE